MTAILNSYFYTPHERTYHNMSKKNRPEFISKSLSYTINRLYLLQKTIICIQGNGFLLFPSLAFS